MARECRDIGTILVSPFCDGMCSIWTSGRRLDNARVNMRPCVMIETFQKLRIQTYWAECQSWDPKDSSPSTTIVPQCSCKLNKIIHCSSKYHTPLYLSWEWVTYKIRDAVRGTAWWITKWGGKSHINLVIETYAKAHGLWTSFEMYNDRAFPFQCKLLRGDRIASKSSSFENSNLQFKCLIGVFPIRW